MTRAGQHVLSVALRLAFPLALCAAFLLAIRIRFYSGWFVVNDLPSWPAYTAYLAASVAAWSALEARYSLVKTLLSGVTAPGALRAILKTDLLALALVSSASFFWRGYSFSRWTVCLMWAMHAVFCLLGALAARHWLRRSGARRSLWVLDVGGAGFAECLPAGAKLHVSRCADAAAAIAQMEEGDVPPGSEEALIVLPASEAHRMPAAAAAAERLPVPAAIAVRDFPCRHVERAGPFAVFAAGAPTERSFDYVFLKRALDAVLSAAGLVLLAPLFLLIAAITRVHSGAPVLIAQERVGRGGRRFRLYKFRSLPVAALARSQSRWTEEPADAWGRLLRATGLDELPQLVNVLRGEMSLVGPRPERPRFVEQFRRGLPFYSTRHRLQPGITGWAQVHGLRGDTSIAARAEHDLYYLRHWSLELDFRILWLTMAHFIRALLKAGRHERSVHAGSV